SGLADDLLDGIDRLRSGASEAFDPVLRLGVTGLSGAGKSVFITAVIASLLSRERLRMMPAASNGRIAGAMLRPHPEAGVPRFPFEAHRAALQATEPAWPPSTRGVSQIRVALRIARQGFAAGLMGAVTEPLVGPRILNLDITDYPGEWLLDLPLLDQDYETWAAAALAAAETAPRRQHAAAWHAALAAADPAAAHDESTAAGLAEAYRTYLWACRADGLSALAPGRFLMPGDMAGAPALAFVPLPRPEGGAKRRSGSLRAEMARRFEAYKQLVVKPFFRAHFARLDRQVVLVDVLGALTGGPAALSDLQAAMAETLACFRHGRSGWLDQLLGQRRIDRILFASSKADLVPHGDHDRLSALTQAMLADATGRAAFRGAKVKGMAIAAVRATAEQEITRNGEPLPVLRGQRADGREIGFFPGSLPEDPAALLHGHWPEGGEAEAAFARPQLAPPRWNGGGPPHLRLDRALDWVIGDKL
ncbi:MAG: YcjX family protein, partial [Pseudomonadota bacterium]